MPRPSGKPLAHQVLPEEVEEVFFNRPHVRRTRGGRHIALGVTEDGRLITVIFILKSGAIVRPITARPMEDDERRLYLRHGDRNGSPD